MQIVQVFYIYLFPRFTILPFATNEGQPKETHNM